MNAETECLDTFCSDQWDSMLNIFLQLNSLVGVWPRGIVNTVAKSHIQWFDLQQVVWQQIALCEYFWWYVYCTVKKKLENNWMYNYLENHKQPAQAGIDCDVLLKMCNFFFLHILHLPLHPPLGHTPESTHVMPSYLLLPLAVLSISSPYNLSLSLILFSKSF